MADHILTLQTLIDKYVHCHREKVYTCFDDFEKAFDSVWHDGLLYKLLKINAAENFYDLINNLYYNSAGYLRTENFRQKLFSMQEVLSRRHFKLTPNYIHTYIHGLFDKAGYGILVKC